jgi:hypothetical protein
MGEGNFNANAPIVRCLFCLVETLFGSMSFAVAGGRHLGTPLQGFGNCFGFTQGVALGSGWGAPLGLSLAPTARFSRSPGQRPGTRGRKR